MNWEAVGAIGEVLGAAGVIITLALLAYQVIQTRIAIRSSAYQSYSKNKIEMTMFLSPHFEAVLWAIDQHKAFDHLREALQ